MNVRLWSRQNHTGGRAIDFNLAAGTTKGINLKIGGLSDNIKLGSG